jgi:SIT4-associating protein SAP185/190
LKNENLIPILLSYLPSEHPASVQTSAGDFLKAIITISANATQNEQSCIGPNSLTRQLVSAQCIEQLIHFMLQGGNSLTVGVGIVIEVIRKNNSDYDPENMGGPDAPPSIYDPIYLGTLLRHFAKHIPDFMSLILSSKHSIIEGGQVKVADRGQLTSAWGTTIEPLGFDRFKTCELMAELLHCSNMGLLNEIGSEDYIRQRDADRERLLAQGAFDVHKKDEAGVDYSETAGDFTNGSGFDSEVRAPENNNDGEYDGFEDVGSSGVLVDESKGQAREGDSGSEARLEPFGPASQKPKSHIEDDLVEESLSTPAETLNAGEQTTSAQPSVDPVSPSASGLTDQVGDIKIDTEEQPSSPLTEQSVSRPVEVAQGKINPDTAALSPHPEDTPAPLFASTAHVNSQSPESTNAYPSSDNIQSTAGEIPESLGARADDEFAPLIQIDVNGQPIVGDFLKIMFVEHKVVPTILVGICCHGHTIHPLTTLQGFFFRFPWNNFLHNVVYDVIQQVFNGPMDRGYNRSLAIDLFDSGCITEQIVEGQRRSDEAQVTKNMRLGYMGHLTLIAEEVVKFTERHPPEILSQTVMDNVVHHEWVEYVERTLSETRERDNAILGGVRPDIIGHRQAVLNAVGAAQGFTGSNALANAGLNGGGGASFESFDAMTHGSASSGAFGLGGSNSLLSGFGSSSDDEDEEMEDQDDEEVRNSDDIPAESGSENVGDALFTDVEMDES